MAEVEAQLQRSLIRTARVMHLMICFAVNRYGEERETNSGLVLQGGE